MKFKLERIESMFNALTYICRMDIISKTSYWLGKFKNKVESEYKDLQEMEDRLRNKYGCWKYPIEKEVVKDNKTVKETSVLSLKGTEKEKHWENEKGEKVEITEQFDQKKAYWKGNSDEDTLAFKDELKSLLEQEFEIPYEPLEVNRLVRWNAEKQTEEDINIVGEILAALDGILTDTKEVKTVKETEKTEVPL